MDSVLRHQWFVIATPLVTGFERTGPIRPRRFHTGASGLPYLFVERPLLRGKQRYALA